MTKLLTFEQVTVSVTLSKRPVEVLRNLDFSLEAGQTLGLVGESGAGKSMVGRTIAGLLPSVFKLSQGRLLFEGRDLTAMKPAARQQLLGRRIAFIPQEPLSALNPIRTIGSQFREHLVHSDASKSKWRTVATDWLARMGLPDSGLLRRYPHELSGGQCQRVLIAMAFSIRPALVVADEPTTALDPVTQNQIMALIAEQQASNATAMIFITHDLRLAASICHDVGVIYAGELVEWGPARDVLRAPRHPYTQELIAAIPVLFGPRRTLPNLMDHMPGLDQLADLPGCRFASRCKFRDPACVRSRLPPTFLSDTHWIRCADSCSHQLIDLQSAARAEMVRAKEQHNALITFEKVGLHYRGGRDWLFRRRSGTNALHDVSFELGGGEILGIIGESGSGKSSAGRVAAKLSYPTSGRVVWADTDIGLLHLSREAVQLVFQDPQSALNPRRSVLRLLTQYMEIDGSASHARVAAARKLAADVGLPPDCLGRYPSQLSGGQRQRVNIGRALCPKPRVIIADEIVSGLDVSVQAQVLNLLEELNTRDGLAILLISHDLAVVRHLCHRLLVFLNGEIVEEGVPDTVFSAPRHPYTQRLVAASTLQH